MGTVENVKKSTWGEGYFSNKRLVLFIIALTLVLIIGTSYALWNITLKQTDENKITSGCFKIIFKDQNPIYLENAYPMTKEEGKRLIPYEFTIENNCGNAASYQINLELTNTTTLQNLEHIRTMLNESDNFLNENEEVEKTLDNATIAYKLSFGYLEKAEKKDFTLRLWLDENTPTTEEYMNKVLESRVTIITTSLKKIDKVKPVANATIKKEGNNIIVDASTSEDDYSGVKKYYYSLDGETYIKQDESTFITEDKGLSYGIADAVVKSAANFECYIKVEDGFGNISDVKKVSLQRSPSLVYDKTTDNNLRYIGKNPNNYVRFNNELWRIIGVMNNMKTNASDKGESRVKIIKATPYSTNMAWNTSDATRNSWAVASSNATLNGTYYNSFTEEAKEMTSLTLWNIGEVNGVYAGNEYSPTNGDTAMQFYRQERGTAVNSERTSKKPTWVGRIGLMYASDYGFATSGGESYTRETCLNRQLGRWNDIYDCYGNSWLFRSDRSQWTLSMKLDDYNSIFYIYNGGEGSVGSVSTASINYNRTLSITPALYLKTDVKIISGDGSSSNPFELSLN
ncbi:MAG: hypothetical protein HFG48_01840 [Bacilli bacterium]|nr:hypothetical protein [Bacilli bacterium]